jgi:hypothetical protein
LRGSSVLQSGDPYMVAMACHHDSRPNKRPLRAPWMALVQPPFRRPLDGFSSAFIVLAAPSGFVPGGGEGGRRWSSRSPGGGEGPDCFSCNLFRVLFVRSEDCFVISFSPSVLCKLYPHRRK